MVVSARSLLAAACLLAVATSHKTLAQKINVACEGLTGIDGCTECSNTNGPRCVACHMDRGASWAADGRVTECRATVSGAAARTASGDTNCLRADGQWCIQCNRGFFFDSDFKCVASTKATAGGRSLEVCQQTSGNTACIACNPDGTCRACRSGLMLVPLNAMFVNAPALHSRCMTLAALNTEAKAITWANAVVPTNCTEVDTEFKCSRCRDGFSLTGGSCKPEGTTGSGCATTVGYRWYCAKCNAAGTACTQCNGARSIVRGACSLPCRQLYGIGCRRCSAVACLERDAAYANGRR